MMKHGPRILFPAVAAAVLLLEAPALANDKMSEAIDRGIEFLLPLTEQRLQKVQAEFGNGPCRPTQKNDVGRLAFEVYALVVAGVSVEHPTIKASFETLSRMTYAHTYSVALYVFALDAAISQVEDDLLMLQSARVRARVRDDPRIGAEYRPRLASAVEHFVRTQNQLGAWRYGPGARDFDNSNVQFAVLALGVGAKRGVPIDPSVWIKVMDHFVKGQQDNGAEIADRITMKPPEERGIKQDDVKIIKRGGRASGRSSGRGRDEGASSRTVVVEDPQIGTEDIEVLQRGWDYTNKGKATWNMTCAGLSSLLLARENLRGQIDLDAKQALDKSIRDGYGWVMGHWSPNENYYGMYSLEKVGDIGEVVKFGKHDWYKEMSDWLIEKQNGNGGWSKGRWADDDAIATSYALLILNRATSLLAMDRTGNIVISGKRGAVAGQEDRNWVYVRKLDTSLNVPAFLRAVRLRPSSKLIRFLEDIVVSYPEVYRGELIPGLVEVREAVPSKTVHRVLDGYLEVITGYEYSDPETYMKWYRRWQRVLQIGESRDPQYKDALLQYYESTNKSLPLKKLIMWALVQCKVREAIPLFLADLEHEDAEIRQEAYNRFRDFFIDYPPPFNAKAGKSTRDQQVAAIKAWYAKQGT